jgi:hypothetical protein
VTLVLLRLAHLLKKLQQGEAISSVHELYDSTVATACICNCYERFLPRQFYDRAIGCVVKSKYTARCDTCYAKCAAAVVLAAVLTADMVVIAVVVVKSNTHLDIVLDVPAHISNHFYQASSY